MKKVTIILFLLFNQNALAQEISGVTKIIDGDTVHINNYKIRLEGIDAPEIKQKCEKPFWLTLDKINCFQIDATTGDAVHE